MSLLTPMLRSSPLTDWFSDAQRVQGMLDFEAALAQAQAACGMVPPEAVGQLWRPAATKPSILPRWARRQWEPVIWPSRW